VRRCLGVGSQRSGVTDLSLALYIMTIIVLFLVV